MMEIRRTQLLDDLRIIRKCREVKEEAEIEKEGNDSLWIEHKEEIKVVFYKYMDLLISSKIKNDNTQKDVCQDFKWSCKRKAWVSFY